MLLSTRGIFARCTNYMIQNDKDNPKHVPDIINVKFLSFFDALRYHEFALNYIDNMKTRLPDLNRRLEELKQEMSPSQTYVERQITMEGIREIEDEIKKINSEIVRKQYLEKSLPLVEMFNKLGSSIEREEFGKKENRVPEEVISLTVEIITVIKTFTTIKFDINIPCRVECMCCFNDLTDLVTECEIALCCPKCSTVNNVSAFSRKFKMVDKFLPSVSGEYSDKQNFYKFYIRFRGDQGTLIDDSILSILDNYFIKRKKKIGKDFENVPLNYKGFKDGTSFNKMLKAMKSCKLSDYYDDIYLICKKYWGWKLAEMDSDEQSIMYIYVVTQKEYTMLKNKKRSSSISVPLHFFKIVEMLGYPYDSRDFKIPKEEKSKLEQEGYWKFMCENSKDPSIIYKPTVWDFKK